MLWLPLFYTIYGFITTDSAATGNPTALLGLLAHHPHSQGHYYHVFLITAIIATAVTFLLPESYASTARIKIEPDIVKDFPAFPPEITYATYDPYFIQTEFEVIQDRVVLGKVIEALNLNEEWGKRYYGGATLKTPETMEFLKRRMSLSPMRNTKLIGITIYSEDKNEAALIANEIAEAYRDYRLNIRRQQTLGGIKVLEDQFQSDEQQIQIVQSNVDNLRQELDVNDNDPNAMAPRLRSRRSNCTTTTPGVSKARRST